MQQQLVNRVVLIALLIGISLLFLALIKPFLLAIFVAALFAALFSPLYRKILNRVGQRRALASGLTLITIILFVMVPVSLLLGVVTRQALDIADTAVPWVQQQLATPGVFTETLQRLPFYEYIAPYRDLALDRVGDLAGTVSGWVVEFLQSATKGTVTALLGILIVLYTLFFFLIDGDRLLYYVLYYLPLNDEDETRLLERFTSVTRATLKGTAVIGILQGGLAGLALYFAGIPSALFWSFVMMLMSVVPGVGAAIVWVPAVIYLLIGGQYMAALAVAVFCILVVGTVDNLLRPKLVGNDTKLHELLIFFSTLGGLMMFGFMGFVIGPIIAALFVTLWELYGDEFQDWLPTTSFAPQGKPMELPHQRYRRVMTGRTGETEWQAADVETLEEHEALSRTATPEGSSEAAGTSSKSPAGPAPESPVPTTASAARSTAKRRQRRRK